MSIAYLSNDYKLLPVSRKLLCGRGEVELQPKVFDLLALLMRYPDQVISKADLLAALWPDQSVTEAALTRLVKEARRAVGDDGAQQRLIRTVRRRGYRWEGSVRVVEEGPSAAAPADAGRSPILAREPRLAGYRAVVSSLARAAGASEQLLAAALDWASAQRRGLGSGVDDALLERVLAISRLRGRGDDFARAALLLAGDVPSWRPNERVRALLKEASAFADSDHLRASALARAATDYSANYLEPEAAELRSEAFALASQAGWQTLLDVLSGQSDWIWQGVAVADKPRLARNLLERAEDHGDPRRLLAARLLFARESMAAGDRAQFERVLGDVERESAAPELAPYRYRCVRLRIAHAIMAGEFERAQSLLDSVAEPIQGVSLGQIWDDQSAQIVTLMAARERIGEIAPLCGSLPSPAPTITARCFQLWLAASQADPVQARFELAKLLPSGNLAHLHPADAALVAASCALLGDASPAAALTEALLPHAGRHVVRDELLCYGPADYFLGVLAELVGDAAAARKWFVSAEALAAESGASLALMRSRIHLARLADGSARPAWAGKALADAERFGLVAASRSARSLLSAG